MRRGEGQPSPLFASADWLAGPATAGRPQARVLVEGADLLEIGVRGGEIALGVAEIRGGADRYFFGFSLEFRGTVVELPGPGVEVVAVAAALDFGAHPQV